MNSQLDHVTLSHSAYDVPSVLNTEEEKKLFSWVLWHSQFHRGADSKVEAACAEYQLLILRLEVSRLRAELAANDLKEGK